MAFKGFHSILFDFYSLIDAKISLNHFIKGEYRDAELRHLNKHMILYTEDSEWIWKRQFGVEEVFKSLILDDEAKTRSKDIFDELFKENEEEILEKYPYETVIPVLIKAYEKAGEGTIRTAVRCETEAQKKYIEKHYPSTPIEFNKAEDVDLSKYGRFVVGDYHSALKYRPAEPKSILVLNFRENFNEKDSTQLKPELIIKFGDIHDIGVISAYRLET